MHEQRHAPLVHVEVHSKYTLGLLHQRADGETQGSQGASDVSWVHTATRIHAKGTTKHTS